MCTARLLFIFVFYTISVVFSEAKPLEPVPNTVNSVNDKLDPTADTSIKDILHDNSFDDQITTTVGPSVQTSVKPTTSVPSTTPEAVTSSTSTLSTTSQNATERQTNSTHQTTQAVDSGNHDDSSISQKIDIEVNVNNNIDQLPTTTTVYIDTKLLCKVLRICGVKTGLDSWG